MKKLSGIILIGAVVLAGCSKSYYDQVNINPNNSTNASVDLVLAAALKQTAAPQITTYAIFSEWMNYWSPSGSYAINSSDGSSYKQTTDFADNNGFWSNIYDNLEDYDYIERTATANNQYFYIAAAKTMKAYLYMQLVDMFSNVPYTEALKGASNLTPKYDNGKDIYEALANELGTAVTYFQRADAVGSLSQDVLFGTTPLAAQGATATLAIQSAQWARFANTLKLRLLMHQTEVAGRAAYIQTEMNKIVANGAGFLSQYDAAVNPGYSNSSGKQNPFYGSAYNTAGTYIQDFWRAAKFNIDFTTAHNDPRKARWYAPIGSGAFVGTTLGASGNPVGSQSSTWGPGVLKSVSQSAPLMSIAEGKFLQAEAMLRGYLAGSAQTAYQEGVTASFVFLGLTAAQAATYYSQGGDKEVNWAATSTFNERLNLIMRQKWLALQDVNPMEAWNDYRRLFYLNLPWSAQIVISQNPGRDADAIPIRVLYPTIEYQTNAAQVGTQAQTATAHHTSKVWWMP